MSERWRAIHPRAVLDVVLAAACAGVLSAGLTGVAGWVAAPLVAACCLPVAVRRRWPVPAAAVAIVAAGVAAGLGGGFAPFVVAAFALYAVAAAARRPRWEPTAGLGAFAVAGAVAAVAAGPVPLLPAGTGRLLVDGVLGVVALAVAWTIGRAVRERRAYAARTAERMAEQAVAAERLRIARELHDVVAHSMGIIAVQAGVANHVLPTRPEQAHAALRVIETTSREALVEMRRLVGVLRSDDEPDATAPAPGLPDLTALVERAGEAGVRATLEVRGGVQLPPAAALSVFRIVQEALTNVVAHAAPARCRILVDAERPDVRVEVTDDGAGPGRNRGPGGYGLIGIRERAALFGGTVEAGPVTPAGFRVRVTLPAATAGAGDG